MQLRISEDDFKAWWTSPVGVEVQNMLRYRMQELDKSWQVNVRDEKTLLLLAGRKLEILDLIEMSFKELMGE